MTLIEIKKNRLSKRSGLYHYLKGDILCRMKNISHSPDLRIKKLNGSHEVYLLEDRKSNKKFVLKSFYEENRPQAKMISRMNKEYGSLRLVQKLQIGSSLFRTVKPFSKSDENMFFIEEHAPGKNMSHFLKKYFEGENSCDVYNKLSLLAGYLSSLHSKTKNRHKISSTSIKNSMIKHSLQAYNAGALDNKEIEGIEKLLDRWRASGLLKTRAALIHGDATPANFIYENGHMRAIDLERSRYSDPAYDLGTMAGELFHYALRYCGNPYRADPLIGHLYWMYSGNFNDQYTVFLSLTKRNPLYMANSLFRISRNDHFDQKYKKRLAYHALECLKYIDRID
jgi:thiamine kinase-like enzyme